MVAAAWMIGMLVTWFVMVSGAAASELLVAIALGSGLVAIIASIPGTLIERVNRRRGDASSDVAASVRVGFFIGVLIRLGGTVALAAWSRYQLPATAEQIAVATLVWYCYLTATEVITLAIVLSRCDGLVDPSDTFAGPNQQNVNPSIQ